jgi:hypothetical protein
LEKRSGKKKRDFDFFFFSWWQGQHNPVSLKAKRKRRLWRREVAPCHNKAAQ